jgi:hypothetical protein
MRTTTYESNARSAYVCVCVCETSCVCAREYDSFMILIKVEHVKSHTACTSSVQAVYRLYTTPAPTQSSRRQKGDTKPVPYWGPTDIRRQRITFSDHGDVARLWCTPVPLWHTDRRLLEPQNYRISTPKYYGQLWHRKVSQVQTSAIYAVFWTGVLRWNFGSHSLETRGSLWTAAKTNINRKGFLEHLWNPPHGRQLPRVLSCSTVSTSVCYRPNKFTFVTIRMVARLQQMLLIT